MLEKELFWEREVIDHAAETAKIVLERNRRFVLFGAGITGEKVGCYLKSYGLKAECYCDNNPAKQGQIIAGLRVLSFDEMLRDYPDALIVISCDAFMEITQQLIQAGLNKESIVYFEPDWLNNPGGQGEYIREHIEEFEQAYKMMSDQRSRDVFAGLLNYKITHDLSFVEGLADKTPYFDELISLKNIRVFFDCGAFIGDSMLDYVRETKGSFDRIVCFEPNPENVSVLKENIISNSLGNVDVLQYALSDHRQVLNFGGSSEGGRIVDDGGFAVQCDSIDNLCLDKYSRVDYIKMDIEGSEYYALKGAGKIIERDHPVLAICVYHRKDDFFVLPKLIKELHQSYNLYFRQYELSGEETVCYAIPNEEHA